MGQENRKFGVCVCVRGILQIEHLSGDLKGVKN